MADLISVIVTTYDREDALAAVLRGLARQRDTDFEIVVADDGSGPQTASLIGSWTGRVGVPLRHVWHEHRGFRAGEIRNRAVAASSGEWLVFLDGDCIPPANFVARHRRLAEPGWFVAGNRILLAPEFTVRALDANLEPEAWPWWVLVRHKVRGDLNRLIPAVTLPLGPARKLLARRWKGARSCNLAVARADFLRVDGFDASYAGWGLEDSDLAVRLIHAGVHRKDGRFATGVFHLWHPQNDRSGLGINEARLMEVIANGRVRAQRGLSSLSEGPSSSEADQASSVTVKPS